MKVNLTKVLTVITITIFSEFVFVGCSTKGNSTLAASTEDVSAAHVISRFDPILQDAATQANLDWKLLSAIAYAESRFQPMARSKAGAIGLMQVMPHVAKQYGVSVQEAMDPETNVEVAIQVLKKIETTLRFGKASDTEKVKIILAGYNSGIGNLIEARKLAVADGANHNDWESLKNYGAVNNPETRSFVSKVITKWNQYNQLN